MAKLYDVDVRTINYHIKRIIKDSELQEEAVIRKYWITAEDGKSYKSHAKTIATRQSHPYKPVKSYGGIYNG